MVVASSVLKAANIMSNPAILVPMNTRMKDASALMLENMIGCLPVVNEDDRYQGMFTKASLDRGLADQFAGSAATSLHAIAIESRIPSDWNMERLKNAPVSRYMDHSVVGVGLEENIVTIRNAMLRNEIDYLPVLAQGFVLGVVGMHDLLAAIVDEHES